MGRNAAAEAHSIKDAAKMFSETAYDDMKKGGDGADRITAEIVGRSYHADPTDLAAFGVVGAQLKAVLQARAYENLKGSVHLEPGISPFREMQDHGRFFCG